MFKYESELFENINVEQENLQYASLLQENLRPINMGLRLSVQYMTQAFKIDNSELRELLLKLSAEELSVFEQISLVIKRLSGNSEGAQSPLNSLSGENIVATGELCTDLLSDIALEQQAKSIYESILGQVEDSKLRMFLQRLIEREEEHSLLLREAFNKIQRRKIKEEFKTTKEARMCFSTIKPVIKENSYEDFRKTPPAISR